MAYTHRTRTTNLESDLKRAWRTHVDAYYAYTDTVVVSTPGRRRLGSRRALRVSLQNGFNVEDVFALVIYEADRWITKYLYLYTHTFPFRISSRYDTSIVVAVEEIWKKNF